jgi:hypothetical protein
MGSKPEDVRALVRDAAGKECWSVLATESGDDALVIDLGEKQRRSLRLANPHLSFVQRTYEGEFSFLIECVWRLDGSEGVIVTSLDEDRAHGVRTRKMKVLEGRSLKDAVVENEGYDLTLVFDGGYYLRCFAALAAKRRINWSFASPSVRVSIHPFGRPEIESRKTMEKRLEALKRAIRGDEGDTVATFLRTRGLDSEDEEVVKARGPAQLIQFKGSKKKAASKPSKPAKASKPSKPAKKAERTEKTSAKRAAKKPKPRGR